MMMFILEINKCGALSDKLKKKGIRKCLTL